ncbi:hypothetical protein QWY93_17625 [Echinicola jeungdonensis]|uniref:Lipocalin-like domain-containing protein n=1 Tax=Echinicola jeungdonensis TaxID=709343 RepID=A0ABV5J096_9BACT|nr:hypothetical protein [Echinicola jeungdonensis]MDN3671136.1 hypothetical protein [Echinicola jeungdonensis]
MENLQINYGRKTGWFLVLLLSFACIFTNCGIGEDSVPDKLNDLNKLGFKGVTGNIMEARVNGNDFCTPIGTAIYLDIDAPRLSILGLFGNANPGFSKSLNLENPGEGTYSLTDGQFGTDNEEEIYAVHEEKGEGSGTVTITELSNSRVKGTFELTDIGIDTSGNPNGKQVEVTKGDFDLAIDYNQN